MPGGRERLIGPECPRCQGCYTRKFGKTTAGNQTYRCGDCKRNFVINPTPQNARHTGHKRYVCISPAPEFKEYQTTNLTEFCRGQGLDPNAMSKVSRGLASHHKGWGCICEGKVKDVC